MVLIIISNMAIIAGHESAERGLAGLRAGQAGSSYVGGSESEVFNIINNRISDSDAH